MPTYIYKPATLMGTSDYARLMGVNPETVRNWIRSGKVRGYKVGRNWVVEVES